jgi:filamentous hemagglutinin family protein
MTGPLETVTVSGTGLTGPVNFDVKTQSVLYANSNATANWWLNVRGNSTTTLNSVLSTGQSATVSVLNQNGATAYYPTGPSGPIAIDGVGVTPKWFTGSAPTSGNINSTDIYTFTIIKTGVTGPTGAVGTYSVMASSAKYA